MIPADRLLPQDMVDVWDLGPADKPHKAPHQLRMHAVDAKHALTVEPKRYVLNLPKPKMVVVEPEPEPEPERDTDRPGRPLDGMYE